MEEDDDVILEGSSLHQYLVELGCTDFEVIQPENISKQTISDVTKYLGETKAKIQSFGFDSFIYTSDILSQFIESVTLKIIFSRVMDEEDLLILETLSPGVHKICSNPEILNAEITQKSLPGLVSLGIVHPSLLTHVLCGFCLSSISFLIFRNWLVDSLPLAICVLFSLVQILIRLKTWFYCYRAFNKINELVDLIQSTNSVGKKSLKCLNEINIMRRGLIRKDISTDSLTDCYESNVLVNTYRLLKSLSSSLFRSHSYLVSCGSMDFNSLFCDRFSAEVIETKEKEESLNYTEIKTLKVLTESHWSAFLTELLLYIETSGCHNILNVILYINCDNLKKSIALVSKSLSLWERIYMKGESSLSRFLEANVKYEKMKTDLIIPADSLSLHCRMLAHYSLHFKQIVENIKLCNESVEQDNYENIRKHCIYIKSELNSCNGCLEEIMERNDSLFKEKMSENNRNSLSITKTEVSLRKEYDKNNKEFLPSHFYGLEDPVIEDEVFEAFVDKNETEAIVGCEAPLSQDKQNEMKMKRKQRERCKRVLQEIQPILLKRREMWVERESEALKRMQSINKEDSINEETRNFYNYNEKTQKMSLETTSNFFGKDSLGEENLSNTIGNIDEAFIEKLEEYDSEEERLLLYKKVKKELDEDEARRQNESDDTESESECDRIGLCDLKFPKSNCVVNVDAFQAPESPYKNTNSFKISFDAINSKDILFNDLLVFSNQDKIVSEGKDCESSTNYNSKCDTTFPSKYYLYAHQTDKLQKTSLLENPNISEGQEFSCAESSDEGENFMDWSARGFVRYNKNSDKETEQRDSVPFSGLPPALALEAFRRGGTRVQNEEVFGGIGEKDGSESESENSSNE